MRTPSSIHSLVRRPALGALAVALCASLTACSGSSKADASGNGSAAETTIAAAPGTDAAGDTAIESGAEAAPDTIGAAVTSLSEQPGASDDGFVGAAKDVTLSSCKQDGAKWKAEGTVTNDSGDDASYRIYVAMIVPGSTDTKALVQVDVEVADGKTEKWSTSADVSDESLSCVLRVERSKA